MATNDYQTSTGPAIGGHLSSFRREWLELLKQCLNIMTNGYILPFITKPFLTRQSLILWFQRLGHMPLQGVAS